MSELGEIHLAGVSDAEGARVAGTVWVVTLDGDWWTGTQTIAGRDVGRSFSTTYRHVVEAHMGFLGLVRHEAGPDDAPNVVETWHVDPEPAHPCPPTVPGPPRNPPS